MAGNLFAVRNIRGPNWDDSKPMEDQANLRAHADFMSGLAADGFVLLGGPFKGLLRNLRIEPWELRLGSLDP